MPTRITRLTHQVEITKICNQSARFRFWWVGGKLEFSQPASSGLDKNIGFYPSNLICAHPYQCQSQNDITKSIIYIPTSLQAFRGFKKQKKKKRRSKTSILLINTLYKISNCFTQQFKIFSSSCSFIKYFNNQANTHIVQSDISQYFPMSCLGF